MSLAHLDPELRDVFGFVLTKWRGMTKKKREGSLKIKWWDCEKRIIAIF